MKDSDFIDCHDACVRFYNYRCKLCGEIISKQKWCNANYILRDSYNCCTKSKDFHKCPKMENEDDTIIYELISKTINPPSYANRIIFIEKENEENEE